MKKGVIAVFLAAAVLSFVPPARGATEPVKIGIGTLQISGLFQIGLNYYIGDEVLARKNVDRNGDRLVEPDEKNLAVAEDRAVDMEFVVRRIRLAFSGTVVTDKVGYFFQAEFGKQTGPELLDARLAFAYIPYTTLSFGRFVPKFTYWAPMFMGNIFLIELPQMNGFLGVQRQTGASIGVFHKYFEVDVGAANGRGEPHLSLNPADRGGAPLGCDPDTKWDDENTAKDAYASIAIKPIEGLRVFGGYWYGQPLDYFEVKNGEKIAHNVLIGIANGGIAFYSPIGLHLWGEIMSESVSFDDRLSTDPNTKRPADTTAYQALSWYAMGAYNFKNQGVPLEIAARYDFLDPDVENDAKTHGKDDETTYITGGFNYYIENYYAMFSINYVYRSEKLKVLNKKLSGTQAGVSNDDILAQVQIAF